jgi:hypothetical protein
MTMRPNAIVAGRKTCQWISLREALNHFAVFDAKHQSAEHIKPLHWYIACRLVIEGGFHPDEITPHPPFRVQQSGRQKILHYDDTVATGSEQTVLGGLKTKHVDVVISKNGIGPVLAVSCKGMLRAFRNLTNRLEETIGECTNLHITYPAMVFGYLFIARANREAAAVVLMAEDGEAPPAAVLAANDIALKKDGSPTAMLVRFSNALREMTGRHGIRNDISRYEAMALGLVETQGARVGELLDTFPPQGDPLHLDTFFATMYARYEQRFVITAPDLLTVTNRIEWSPDSPALRAGDLLRGEAHHPALEYEPRVSD